MLKSRNVQSVGHESVSADRIRSHSANFGFIRPDQIAKDPGTSVFPSEKTDAITSAFAAPRYQHNVTVATLSLVLNIALVKQKSTSCYAWETQFRSFNF